jgi:hypothetical protein
MMVTKLVQNSENGKEKGKKLRGKNVLDKFLKSGGRRTKLSKAPLGWKEAEGKKRVDEGK